jgi:hypothetical protein
VRRVHHVKLGIVPGRPLTAKAYLGASLRLAARGASRVRRTATPDTIERPRV